jgi:copper chaperone CopZ
VKLQTSLFALLLFAAVGCGDGGATPSNLKEKRPVGVPEAVPTADGTMVMSFEFVDDMSPCAHCIGKATEALGGLSGIKKHTLEKGKQEFTVEFDPKLLDAKTLAETLKPIGHDGVLPLVK